MAGQLHAPTALPPEVNPSAHSVGGWVGPRAGPGLLERRNIILPLVGKEPRLLGQAARSQ
jgi:hypothetical protein